MVLLSLSQYFTILHVHVHVVSRLSFKKFVKEGQNVNLKDFWGVTYMYKFQEGAKNYSKCHKMQPPKCSPAIIILKLLYIKISQCVYTIVQTQSNRGKATFLILKRPLWL